MEFIELFKFVADAGLFILIWIVQLVIYPSFTYFSKSDLLKWHPIYTQKISYIVMPLMLTQLFTSGYLVIEKFHYHYLIQLIIIIILWAHTFLVAVPLHNKINVKEQTETISKLLVQKNWIRTILWSVIFILSIFIQFGN